MKRTEIPFGLVALSTARERSIEAATKSVPGVKGRPGDAIKTCEAS